MSLINDLLKDLEKRDQNYRPVPLVALINPKSNIRDSLIQNKFIIITISLITIFLVFNLALKLSSKKNNPSILKAMLQEKKFSSFNENINKSNLSWADPAKITGITIQVKDGITELSFLLTHPALYRLSSKDLQNQISITIEKAQLQSELPPVNYLNTAIQKIASENKAGDIKFNLTLANEATIKYVNLNDDDKNPELVIAIENHAVNKNINNIDSDNSVKTRVVHSLLIERYQTALTAAETGNFEFAIAQLMSLIKLDPDYKEARVSLVALLLDQNKLYKAQQLLNDGLKSEQNYLPFIELKARIFTVLNKPQQALATLQTAIPPISENPEYHAFIAALYERNNKSMLAINTYKQLLIINPNNGNWWLGLGISLEKLGQGSEAIEAYKKAMTAGYLNAQSISYLQKRLQKLQEAEHATE